MKNHRYATVFPGGSIYLADLDTGTKTYLGKVGSFPEALFFIHGHCGSIPVVKFSDKSRVTAYNPFV